MSSKACLCIFFLSFVALFCVESSAEVALTSSSVQAGASASTCLNADSDSDFIPENFTGTFAPDPPLVATGTGGTATTNTNIKLNVAIDGSSITASGTSTFDQQAATQICNGFTVGGRGVSNVLLQFQFVVSGAPVPFHYKGTGDFVTNSINGNASHSIGLGSTDGSFPFQTRSFSCNTDCLPSQTFDFELNLTLPVGTYNVTLSEVADAIANFTDGETSRLFTTWSLTIGDASCDFNWINPEGGIFTDPDNWLSGGFPGNPSTGCDDVFFNLGGGTDYTVVYLDSTVDSATFRGDTVHLAGDTLTLADSLLIGIGALVELGADPPTNELFATSAIIGDIPGAQASMLVSGLDAALTLTESLVVGGAGPGTLIVTAGNVNSVETNIGLATEGDVFVENSGANLLTSILEVGFAGPGTLTIKDGAQTDCDEAIHGVINSCA